ncbi:zinc transport [Fusarium subglutinans]|uniref:Zinc transport n=1 Tax=Gibberella subglutinans TaxID=42677 RepID=A0A8H5Q3P2_GIBSU|nr:zinc transport [Fusarium subglutinans]KAF5608220.1 zinc transport [Fusarium subglutinans]
MSDYSGVPLVMITPSYQHFVDYRVRANPCVSRLSNYLQHGYAGQSKITYLDYTNQSLEPRRIDVPEREISQLLKTSPPVSTRFIFVENVSPGLIILLGEKLDIDPLFFADYIHAAFASPEKTSPPPSLANLSSSIATRDHIHLHCQKVIALEGPDDELRYCCRSEVLGL